MKRRCACLFGRCHRRFFVIMFYLFRKACNKFVPSHPPQSVDDILSLLLFSSCVTQLAVGSIFD